MPAIKNFRAALLISSAVMPILCAAPSLAQEAAQVDEIVVTATRRSEALSKVAASVTAYGQEKLEAQGVDNIDDLSRLTPGLNRTATSGVDNLSVRGIASGVGTSTTGIYIDETPIQSRSLGFFYGTGYPSLFDLERVEVLRGPQGTLFGAGSEGGTIRFIAPSPSLTSFSGHARAEVNTIRDGGTGYEAGVAMGGPIVEDKLGVRGSVHHQRRGGWIDMYTGEFTVVDATGNNLGPASLVFKPTGLVKDNANWTDVTSTRLAVAWKPIEAITLTPSVLYQDSYTYDYVRDFLGMPTASDLKASKFVALRNVPTIDALHRALPAGIPDHQQATETVLLPAFKAEWAFSDVPLFGAVDLVSNTSYLKREARAMRDFTQTYEQTYAGRKAPLPGDLNASTYDADQNSFYQEIRLQSANPDSPLQWVAGVFYSNEQQLQIQRVFPNFLDRLPVILTTGANNGPPFGPGYSAYTNYYGTFMDDYGGMSYYGDLRTRDIQTAVFGQVDYNITEKLKLTAGVRYADFSLSLRAFLGGSNSNLNAPKGRACVPNSNPCIPVPVGAFKPGQGPFAVALSSSTTQASETSTTPKFAIAYQATENHLFYASAAKGFRPGGAQQEWPGICNADLISFGYTDGAGNAKSPTSYDSDTVWSYEGGSKNAFMGGALQISSSLFYIKWKDIQSGVRLAGCAQTLTDNLGDATARGGDIQVHYRPMQGLTLDAVVGYTESSFDQASILSGRKLFEKDSAIPGSPAPITATLSGRYDWDLPNAMPAYVRADFVYASKQRRTGSTDRATVSYVPNLNPPGETQLVNARIGVEVGEGVEVNVFADNLMNAHPDLALSRSANQAMFTNWTFQPRTIGAQISYRF